jgi:hypothetical protein
MTTTIDKMLERYRAKRTTEGGIHVLPVRETVLDAGSARDIALSPNGYFVPQETCFSAVYETKSGETPEGRPDPKKIVIDDFRVGTVSQFSACGPVTLEAFNRMKLNLDTAQPGIQVVIRARNLHKDGVLFRGGVFGRGVRPSQMPGASVDQMIEDLERLKEEAKAGSQGDAGIVNLVRDLFKTLDEDQVKSMFTSGGLKPEQIAAMVEIHNAVSDMESVAKAKTPGSATYESMLGGLGGVSAEALQDAFRRELAMRNAVAVVTRDWSDNGVFIDSKERTLIAPFPETVVGRGDTREIEFFPQCLFRAERLFFSATPHEREGELPQEMVDRILIKDILVGGVSQFYARGGAMPIDMISDRAVRFDTCEPGLTFGLVVHNGSNRPILFHGSAHGRSIR